MKKICFAVLVHEKKEMIADLLENITHFCPTSQIVLYNGGNDRHLCNGLKAPVCPASKKLEYGRLGECLLEVMNWLEEDRVSYDYLVHLDSDVLFARKGFEEFIQHEMKDAEYMGVNAGIQPIGWTPGQAIKKEWQRWKPIFKSDQFLGAFNVGQTFSHDLVRRFLSYDRREQLETNLRQTHSFAIEEIVYVTLASTLGCRIKRYPQETGNSIRFRPYFIKEELAYWLKSNPHSYLFHPIRRERQDQARLFIRSLRN